MLTFSTSGLTKADLKNPTFYAASNNQNISCNFVDDTTKVRCVVAKNLAGKGGYFVTLAGLGFQGQLPKEKSPREKKIVCCEGEILFVNISQYRSGVLAWTKQVSLEMWESFLASPTYASEIQKGYTYVVSAAFCTSDN